MLIEESGCCSGCRWCCTTTGLQEVVCHTSRCPGGQGRQQSSVPFCLLWHCAGLWCGAANSWHPSLPFKRQNHTKQCWIAWGCFHRWICGIGLALVMTHWAAATDTERISCCALLIGLEMLLSHLKMLGLRNTIITEYQKEMSLCCSAGFSFVKLKFFTGRRRHLPHQLFVVDAFTVAFDYNSISKIRLTPI